MYMGVTEWKIVTLSIISSPSPRSEGKPCPSDPPHPNVSAVTQGKCVVLTGSLPGTQKSVLSLNLLWEWQGCLSISLS